MQLWLSGFVSARIALMPGAVPNHMAALVRKGRDIVFVGCMFFGPTVYRLAQRAKRGPRRGSGHPPPPHGQSTSGSGSSPPPDRRGIERAYIQVPTDSGRFGMSAESAMKFGCRRTLGDIMIGDSADLRSWLRFANIYRSAVSLTARRALWSSRETQPQLGPPFSSFPRRVTRPRESTRLRNEPGSNPLSHFFYNSSQIGAD